MSKEYESRLIISQSKHSYNSFLSFVVILKNLIFAWIMAEKIASLFLINVIAHTWHVPNIVCTITIADITARILLESLFKTIYWPI